MDAVSRGKHIRKYVTVEPLLFAFMFCSFLVYPIEEQLVYTKTCFQLYNNSICQEVLRGKNQTFKPFENAVQKETSKWLIYKNVAITIPSILSTMILGSISDQVGRKAVMLPPFIGSLLQATGLIVNSYFMYEAVPYVFIGAVIAGIFGNFASVLTSVYSYVADITDKEARTLRVSILESMTFIGGAVGELIGGVLVDNSGYITAFSLTLVIYFLCVLYIIFWLKESHFPSGGKKLKDLICSRTHFVQATRATFRKRENSRRMFILILLAVFLAQVLVFVGSSEITVLYVRHYPLKWLPSMIGYYLASNMIMKGLGVLVGIPVFLKKFKLKDYTLIVGSFFSTMAMYVIAGFAKETWVMFFSTVIGLGSGISAACIRSMITKLVHESEHASLMAAVASVDVLASLLAHLIFDSVYYATVAWYPGFAFFVMAILLLLPVFGVWFLQFKHQDGVTYVSINAPESDTISEDNGLTDNSESLRT